MESYISKSALVAEIESKKKRAQILGDNAINSSMQQFFDGMKQGCVDILSFFDTLEVKETGTENHINCKVGWYDGVFLDYTQEQLSTLLDKIGANVGDEVKIYITK